ncbi:hypothetical protein AVEN_97829-1 [Araneus ventricosus]|uniref:Uncharacterized protein n=1 Tax=Araneus ventricosus TaxID=182803 RepID=A0A4Y2N6C1_ARAVE|nr:hypothetical protein AVEN_97829-1 [Araneus ventricosus]
MSIKPMIWMYSRCRRSNDGEGKIEFLELLELSGTVQTNHPLQDLLQPCNEAMEQALTVVLDNIRCSGPNGLFVIESGVSVRPRGPFFINGTPPSSLGTRNYLFFPPLICS